jgi:hypothetical protein
MALNGKYISVKQILDELYGDNSYQQEVSFEDCIRWTTDALDHIGHPSQYIHKVRGYNDTPPLRITNYRAQIPCDVYEIRQLAVNGQAARYSGDTYPAILGKTCCGTLPTQNAIELFLDGFDNSFSPQLGATNNVGTTDISFTINNDNITLSVQEGDVCLSYLAYPLDEEGFPLIPENVSFKEAVKKYLTMKLDYQQWRQDPSNSGLNRLYEHSEREWAWYVAQAGNKAKMPNISQMESLKNQMIKLKPEFNEFGNFFKTLGSQERRKRV